MSSNRRIASLAWAGVAIIAAAVLLSGCASDSSFPAVHDMPAARSESKLTPDQIKQATDELISERDRTEQGGTPATTGSTTQRKPAAAQRKPPAAQRKPPAAQSAARPAASSDISASAKQ